MINKKLTFIVSSMVLLVLPLITTADLTLPSMPAQNGITSIWAVMVSILNLIWPLFVGAAIIMIIYAGFMFLTANGDPSKIKASKDAVIWAVIGIIVAILAFSAYGIISNIITAPTGSNGGNLPVCTTALDCPDNDMICDCSNSNNVNNCPNNSGTCTTPPAPGACCTAGNCTLTTQSACVAPSFYEGSPSCIPDLCTSVPPQ